MTDQLEGLGLSRGGRAHHAGHVGGDALALQLHAVSPSTPNEALQSLVCSSSKRNRRNVALLWSHHRTPILTAHPRTRTTHTCAHSTHTHTHTHTHARVCSCPCSCHKAKVFGNQHTFGVLDDIMLMNPPLCHTIAATTLAVDSDTKSVFLSCWILST